MFLYKSEYLPGSPVRPPLEKMLICLGPAHWFLIYRVPIESLRVVSEAAGSVFVRQSDRELIYLTGRVYYAVVVIY